MSSDMGNLSCKEEVFMKIFKHAFNFFGGVMSNIQNTATFYIFCRGRLYL